MTKNKPKIEKPLSEQIKDRVAKEIFSLKQHPNLAIVMFGDDHKYKDNMKRLELEAKRCGVDTHLYICEADSSQMAAEGMIEFLNADDAIDAIHIQGPTPESINFESLIAFVGAEKDVTNVEDFETIDWGLFEARLFESALERFKESNTKNAL